MAQAEINSPVQPKKVAHCCRLTLLAYAELSHTGTYMTGKNPLSPYVVYIIHVAKTPSLVPTHQSYNSLQQIKQLQL